MKAATAAERRHLDNLAALGCILCRYQGVFDTPAQIHHPKEFTGVSQRSSHWLAIPLCPFHHSGSEGLHGLGTKGFYARYKLQEHDLLAMTLCELLS